MFGLKILVCATLPFASQIKLIFFAFHGIVIPRNKEKQMFSPKQDVHTLQLNKKHPLIKHLIYYIFFTLFFSPSFSIIPSNLYRAKTDGNKQTNLLVISAFQYFINNNNFLALKKYFPDIRKFHVQMKCRLGVKQNHEIIN